MNLAVQNLVVGGIVPGVIALITVPLCRRFLPEGVSSRNAAAVAFAAAFFAGYVLLPSWAELRPTRHWHWFAYLGAIAMVVAPVALAAGVSVGERWLLHLLLAVVAASVLVPDWPGIAPQRSVYAALLATYLFLLTALLDALPLRLFGPLFLALLSVVAACVAVPTAVVVSGKFGQLGGIATAATVGCLASSVWCREAITIRGLIPVFTLVVGGLAFVGCIEPQQPLFALLLIPASPLALWTCVLGPQARLQGIKGAAVQIALVFVPLVLAVGAVVLGESGGSPGY